MSNKRGIPLIKHLYRLIPLGLMFGLLLGLQGLLVPSLPQSVPPADACNPCDCPDDGRVNCQGIEQYGDGIILHDTGDLVDDFGVKDDLGNDKSFLFEVTFAGSDPDRIRLRPFHIDDGVRPATDEEAAWLRETMRERAEPFDTEYERAGDGLVVDL